ncbi:MAG: hypothetical protein LBD91_04790 [Prevotellaceae bacterium]|nr:hypothetical protein [Prevotellaceae bacterium]
MPLQVNVGFVRAVMVRLAVAVHPAAFLTVKVTVELPLEGIVRVTEEAVLVGLPVPDVLK